MTSLFGRTARRAPGRPRTHRPMGGTPSPGPVGLGLALAVLFGAMLPATPLATPLAALQTRAELVESARGEFDPEARLTLLTRAADPGMEAPDSLWAMAVFDLAQTLVGMGEEARAAVWINWLGRQTDQWPPDPTYYSPSLVQLYNQAQAQAAAEADPEEDLVRTSWRWPAAPAAPDLQGDGSVQVVAADPALPLEVQIEGEGALPPQGALTLPPGSYDLVATAEGYDEVRVTREVLPGVTTVVEFDPAPTLTDQVRADVSAALALIRAPQAGPELCTTGVLTGPGSLVLTTGAALPGDAGLQVVTARGTESGLSVAEREADPDLAVVRLGSEGAGALPAATEVTARQHAWAAYRAGCQDPVFARTRLLDWGTGPSVHVAPALPEAARGAPVVNLHGALVGLVRSRDEIVPLRVAEGLLARALEPLAPPTTTPTTTAQVPDASGPPWVWIGAGAAAVGVAAAVLVGGGGGGGEPPLTTGGIIITLPGG